MASDEPLLNQDDDNDAQMANTEDNADVKDNIDDKEERKPKRSPNRLMVDDVSEVVQGDGDNSCVLLSVTKMEGVFYIFIISRISQNRIVIHRIGIIPWRFCIN